MIDKIGIGSVPEAQSPSRPQETPAGTLFPKLPEDSMSLSSGKPMEAPGVSKVPKKKKWTVFYYIDGKNNLSNMAAWSFSSIRKAGSDENVNIVAQVALSGSEAERGLVTKEKSKYLFPGSEPIGQVDMGDPKTLEDFIKWGMKNYPAEHYAVVLWDHGAGFKGSMTDDTSKHLIDNKELAQVLRNVKQEAGQEIDVLNFNACLMGQTEVAYEVREGAKYLVGSEEVEAGLRIPIPHLFGTTPQHKVIEDLKAGIKEKGDITPEELSKLYVFESKNQFGTHLFTPTQSAIDLSRIGPVKEYADELAKLLLEAIQKDPKMIDRIRKDIDKTQRFLNYDMFAEPYVDFRDIGDLARTIRDSNAYTDPRIKETAEKLLASVKDSVIAEHHVDESFAGKVMTGATGLSVYLPKDYGHDLPGNNPIDDVPSGGTHGYERTSFAEQTHWDELLKTISQDKDWLGKHPKLRKWLELGLPLAQVEGYEQAWATLGGATKPTGGIIPLPSFPYFLPLPGPLAAGSGIAGGAVRAYKGAQKISAAATKDIEGSRKGRLAISGVLDAVIGAGSIVTCAALLAGAGAVAFPAAAVVMGLGGGRAVVSLAKALWRVHKAGKMTVEEKLATMEKPKETPKKPDES